MLHNLINCSKYLAYLKTFFYVGLVNIGLVIYSPAKMDEYNILSNILIKRYPSNENDD